MLEITRYRLRGSGNADGFVRADSALQQDWYYAQPGCRRRATFGNSDGWWVTLVWWDEGPAKSSTDTDQHPLVSAENPTVAFVDANTLTTELFDELSG